MEIVLQLWLLVYHLRIYYINLNRDLYTDENLSTLQYASKAMNIKVIPQINKDAKTIQIDHLKEENLRLLREIEEIKSRMEKILHYSPSDV